MILNIENLDVFYGDAQALWNITFKIDEGEIVTLVGSNGAGKTTTLKTISGLIRPKKGTIVFGNSLQIQSIKPYNITKMGLVHIPEGRKLFTNMTVLENLLVGAYTQNAWLKKEENLEWVFSLFPRLKERKKQISGTLSGGEQQMLAIGRGLMARPRLLLLDEPSLGLAPILIDQIFNIIKNINDNGVTILLVEQNASLALEIADRGYVLETGKIVLSGSANELQKNNHVKKAYLGL